MGLWQRLFGPSRVDQLLDILKDDRAAQTRVIETLLANAKAQMDVVKQQYDLLTAPQSPAEVRIMTPDVEAAFERQRRNPEVAPVSPDVLLADLARDFRSMSDTFP
jgi:hypothetical protein